MSSSSSSPSTSQNDSGNAAGTSTVRQRRGGGSGEGPSSSRRRAVSEVWPEPFLEALAAQVAIAASRNIGRLAAAAALANVFQVCNRINIQKCLLAVVFIYVRFGLQFTHEI